MWLPSLPFRERARLALPGLSPYAPVVTREQIVRDIHGLDAELTALEEKYSLLSADFHHFYRAGELEQSQDLPQWAGYYEARLERESQYRELVYDHYRELVYDHYRELVYDHLRELRRQAGLGTVQLAGTPA
jgi:hypothetical protein